MWFHDLLLCQPLAVYLGTHSTSNSVCMCDLVLMPSATNLRVLEVNAFGERTRLLLETCSTDSCLCKLTVVDYTERLLPTHGSVLPVRSGRPALFLLQTQLGF